MIENKLINIEKQTLPLKVTRAIIGVVRFASLSDELGVSAECFFLSRAVLAHLTFCLPEVRNFTVLV
jgi:hypothetical protein